MSRIIELVYFHTEYHGRSRFYCPELSNYRIGLISHGASRRVTVLLSRICELHTENRGGHGLIVPRLVLGPTDQREVICELSIFSSHGMSRMVTGFCHELSNYRISFHTEDHGGFLCHKTCSWSRICELSNFFLHTDGRGGYEGGTIEA